MNVWNLPKYGIALQVRQQVVYHTRKGPQLSLEKSGPDWMTALSSYWMIFHWLVTHAVSKVSGLPSYSYYVNIVIRIIVLKQCKKVFLWFPYSVFTCLPFTGLISYVVNSVNSSDFKNVPDWVSALTFEIVFSTSPPQTPCVTGEGLKLLILPPVSASASCWHYTPAPPLPA